MEQDERLSPLIGRTRECARIDALLAGAKAGRSGALVLRGEAGMGKTALLRYATEQATAMRVLRVTGVEAECDLAFAGLHALAWPVLADLQRIPDPQRAAVAGALGLTPGRGGERFLVSAGVLSLLAAAADSGPLLCTVDDAQWLDVPSADALVFAARRLVAEGVVLLFGAREDEGQPFEAAGLEELVLTGLDPEPAATLLRRSHPRMAPVVRRRLLAEAAGNPLALLELPGALSPAQLDGQVALPQALPLTTRLREVFARRMQRLSDSARTALLVAASEDTGQLGTILAAFTALGLPRAELDAVVSTGLLHVHEDQVTLHHPVVRSTVLESAPLPQRRQVHAALADAMEADQPDRALWHRAMATTAPDEPIATALEAAARRSRLDGGHASAASALERAADLGEPPARGRRLGAAAHAAHAAGQANRARGLIDRALPLIDPSQRAALLYLRGLIEGQTGWIADGVATLDAAASASGDPSLTLQILREACAMAFWAGDYDRAASLGRRAIDLPRSTDLDQFSAAVIMAPAAELSGDHDRAAALSNEAITLAERLDDPRCLIWAAMAAAREGQPGAGLSYATRAVDITRRRGLPSILCSALVVQSTALITQGRLDLAYSTSDEGRHLAVDVGQPWAAGQNLVNLALVDTIRGDEDSAHAELTELRTLITRSGAALLRAHLDRTLALLDLAHGRPVPAFERLLAMVSTVRPEGNPLFVMGLPDAVEAAVRADRLPHIAMHLQRYHTWVQRCPTPARRALDARCQALAAPSNADRHFEQAIELAGALGPFDRARTSLLYGEWLRRRRRRSDARRHLRAALELFQQLRATAWEARARTELRATGETARRRDASSTDQLTPQELRIARMVADGMSNPDVAAQLFLSPRTIDYHLRKVFTKLDIASRTELVSVDLGDA